MLSTEKGDDRARSFVTRVLLVLHGAEPAGWPTEACRVLSTWRNPSVRVLVVPIVPFPSFTSMLPAARRRYAGARRAWHQQEEARILVALDRILPGLPRSVEVTRARWSDTDCVETIDQHARDCSADVVVIGAPAPGFRSWLWPGPVHEHVLRRVGCAVLVVRAPATAPTAVRLIPGSEPARSQPGVAHGSV